jgi:hypothetical protein
MDSSTRPSMLSSPPPIPSDSDVDRRRPCRINGIAFRNIDHHSLSCSRQQHTLSISQINLAVIIIDVLPSRAGKSIKLPSAIDRPKIGIPADSDPILL